jgi:hypothetical protein
VAAVGAELVDVGGQGLGDPQPGQQQQARQRVVARAGSLGGVEEPGGLGAVQAEGGRDVVGRGPLDVREWVDRQQAFGDGVAVEAGQDRQPAADGGGGAALLFEAAGVGVDVDAADGQRVEVLAGAPAPPVGQVAAVGVAGVALAEGEQERPREPVGRARGKVEPGAGGGWGAGASWPPVACITVVMLGQ